MFIILTCFLSLQSLYMECTEQSSSQGVGKLVMDLSHALNFLKTNYKFL